MDTLEQYIEEYRRRTAARAALAHQFITVVAAERLCADMEGVPDEKEGVGSSPGSLFRRLLAQLPLPPHQQPLSTRRGIYPIPTTASADADTIIEAVVISRTDCSFDGTGDSGTSSKG